MLIDFAECRPYCTIYPSVRPSVCLSRSRAVYRAATSSDPPFVSECSRCFPINRLQDARAAAAAAADLRAISISSPAQLHAPWFSIFAVDNAGETRANISGTRRSRQIIALNMCKSNQSNMTLIMVDKPQPSYNSLNVMK